MNMKALPKQFAEQFETLGWFVAVMWIAEIVDQVIFHGALDQFVIRPHSIPGLWGILFSPFLHGGFTHLIANTLPFLTLGWFVMVRNIEDFWTVTIVTMGVSGLGVWLFGESSSVHIGASSLVFGYLGFLICRGYFERSFISISLSLLILMSYGGLIWGVLPLQEGVSWEGHLFGFIGGGLAARMIAGSRRD
jgi:membrane associated rhomboid family serine protease